MQSLIEEPISDDVTATLLKAIEEKRWWQGSVIRADHVPSNQQEHIGIDYWMIATQACNRHLSY